MKTSQTNLMEAQEVEMTLREHLGAFGRGDFDAWGDAFAPDVFFTAADPEEVFLQRDPAVAEMHNDFDPAFDEGLQIEVEPRSFRVGIASDCNAAWSAAPLSYRINFQGEINSFVLRHTSVLTRSDQGWLIRATQYSLALAEEKVLGALKAENLPAPHAAGDGIGAGAQVLVSRFNQQLSDFSRATISRDVLVFGPFPGEHAEGEAAVRALFAKWTSKWRAPRLRPDGIRAELISEGLGWVSANVDSILSYADRQVTLPLRVLIVYQKEQENWGIVHAHLSVGIPDDLAE